jgi:hypothetical protein
MALLLFLLSMRLWASEPEALYVRVPINPEQYQAFRQAPLPARLPGDAMEWMPHSFEYRQEMEMEVMRRLLRSRQAFATVSDYLASWPIWPPQLMEENRHDFVVDHYDPEQGVWTFALWEFSENYIEIGEMLTVLRSIAPYARPEESGSIVLYSYEWRHPHGYVFLRVKDGGSQYVEPFPSGEAEKIEIFFDRWARRLTKKYRG